MTRIAENIPSIHFSAMAFQTAAHLRLCHSCSSFLFSRPRMSAKNLTANDDDDNNDHLAHEFSSSISSYFPFPAKRLQKENKSKTAFSNLLSIPPPVRRTGFALSCLLYLACLLARQEGNTKATRVHFSPATTLDLVLGVQASDSFLSTSIKADRPLFREPGRRRKKKPKRNRQDRLFRHSGVFFPFSLDWMETRLFFVYSFPLYLFPCSFERY